MGYLTNMRRKDAVICYGISDYINGTGGDLDGKRRGVRPLSGDRQEKENIQGIRSPNVGCDAVISGDGDKPINGNEAQSGDDNRRREEKGV